MTHQPVSWTGSRRTLRRLRDIMAGSGTAQDQLDRIVTLIARDMVAEVCSVYVRRAGEVLELFATQGLRHDAVHRTRLQIGEGLVGDIAAHARPLALADARSHPLFAFRPETGEEIYSALMGVPILRGGRVLGVLVVQNRTQRQYADEEIETLQTVAMVLAELVAGGELIKREELRPTADMVLLPERLDGTTLSPGLAAGTAVLHQPRIAIEIIVAEDPDLELSRLADATAALQGQLEQLMQRSDLAVAGEPREILETYLMFARDRGWRRRIEAAIRSGLTAEAAVQKVQNDTRARMTPMADAYMRERLLDLDDLTTRLIQHLHGDPPAPPPSGKDIVLIARAMGPAELLNYDRESLQAVVLEEGGATSHVAIIAGILALPMVGRTTGILSRVESGDPVLVDADSGFVYVRPGEDVHARFAESMQRHGKLQQRYAASRDLPAKTRDGVAISLNLNAGMAGDVQHLQSTNTDGVGLYRTEIPFMMHGSHPDVPTQTNLYRRILEEAGDKPVVFRTLDIGGDKLLPHLAENDEANPAMGWRAIRVALDRPSLLRDQCRALLAANAGREMSVMFPMVAEVSEFLEAKRLLQMEVARAGDKGAALPSAIRVGVMFEVPALVWQLSTLLPLVDFITV
ncbi:MAG: putative PEP-binding protein, partial [Alphaproteobacteria bacterium]